MRYIYPQSYPRVPKAIAQSPTSRSSEFPSGAKLEKVDCSILTNARSVTTSAPEPDHHNSSIRRY